jgi:DNA polymerase
MIDAMAMARSLLGHQLVRFSLDAISKHLGLGQKTGALAKVIGLRRNDIINAGLWSEFVAYANQDNDLCEGIFLRLYPEMPWSERRLMDMVLRCCICPRFVGDIGLLSQHLSDVKIEKAKLLENSNVDKIALMSAAKFSSALEALGVKVETKTSPTTGKLIPAIARTDAFMETLAEHPDVRVQALAAARIGLKSTLEETRTEKLLSIASLVWPPNIGTMPVPLRFGGAHTHRLSGDWGMNMQNLPTVRGSKGKSKLRQSLKAPPSCKIIAADLGQIEARLTAWITGCSVLVKEFADKLDPYNGLASSIFNRPVNRKLVGTIDEIMGFIGKTGILGLGYGAGPAKFFTMVETLARAMGIDLSAIGWTQELADTSVEAYRTRYHMIQNGWRRLDVILREAWYHGRPMPFGPVTVDFGCVHLPNGMYLRYADPQEREGAWPDGRKRREFVYRYGKENHTLYGAKFLENIVQALARIVVMNAALRIRDRGKLTPHPEDFFFALQAHDELVYVVHDDQVDVAKEIIHTEMVRRPSWAPDLPLTADIGVGDSYGAAK